uniref:Reverse transcriptase domain-containing protein n=1 Tax=Micrurus lemniscatus lemniscatus TaxID=129467 RepID=A0A2D4HBG7_MICLE
MVFIIEDPIDSGPILLREIDKFGKLAGLKINKEKTKMLVKNLTENRQKELEEIMGLQIINKIKYLGIWLRSKTLTLKEDNYTKLLQQIGRDLKNWNKMQISLLGRFATIKMNVLPKLYLFQMIPI